MQKVIYMFLILSLLVPLYALADQPTPPEASPKKVKTLVDYQSELGLTAEQVSSIDSALAAFRKTVLEQKELRKQYESELSKLLTEHAPLNDIKAKLRQITDVSFNLRFSDVATSRQIEDILSAQQLHKWREIQAKARAASN